MEIPDSYRCAVLKKGGQPGWPGLFFDNYADSAQKESLVPSWMLRLPLPVVTIPAVGWGTPPY